MKEVVTGLLVGADEEGSRTWPVCLRYTDGFMADIQSCAYENFIGLTLDDSKALRKALKRAEKAARGE